MATKIRKRNGVVVAFDASKIKNAVKKANDAVKEGPMGGPPRPIFFTGTITPRSARRRGT